MKRFAGNRRIRSAWLALVLPIVAAGCNSLLDSNQAAFAYEARIIVDGTSAVPLRLVTSTNFIATRDLDSGELVASQVTGDTTILASLPFDHVFNIRGADRFLVRLINPDLDVTATVHLRVRLDDKEVYTQRATMRDATLEYFAYFRF